MEKLVIPEIQPCKYAGQAVLSTGQLAVLFCCKRQNITDIFRRHKNAFVEGVDYFFLKGAELYNFKAENGIFEEVGETCTAEDKFCNTAEEVGKTCTAEDKFCNIVRPFSKTANSAVIWTESGVFKLSKFVHTERANNAYKNLLTSYFIKKNYGARKNPVAIETPKLKKPKIKNNLTFEQLQFLISNCTNASLRDDLIRKAAGNLEPPKCVYVLEMSNGWIKIGMTQDFRRRARQIALETGLSVKNWCHTNYLPPEIARDIESACHANFESCRIDGEFYTTSFDSATAEVEKHEEIFESMTI